METLLDFSTAPELLPRLRRFAQRFGYVVFAHSNASSEWHHPVRPFGFRIELDATVPCWRWTFLSLLHGRVGSRADTPETFETRELVLQDFDPACQLASFQLALEELEAVAPLDGIDWPDWPCQLEERFAFLTTEHGLRCVRRQVDSYGGSYVFVSPRCGVEIRVDARDGLITTVLFPPRGDELPDVFAGPDWRLLPLADLLEANHPDVEPAYLGERYGKHAKAQGLAEEARRVRTYASALLQGDWSRTQHAYDLAERRYGPATRGAASVLPLRPEDEQNASTHRGHNAAAAD